MSRSSAASEASLRAIELGHDGWIGRERVGPAAGRHPRGSLGRHRGDEVAAVEDGAQRVADQRVGFPEQPEQARATRRRCEDRRDVHEQPPARFGHRPRRRELPHGEAERLERIGHHLLMPDGDVDVVLPVVGDGNGKQRRDRPALDELEVVVGQAPFDVLRRAEVRGDAPARLREPHDLRVGERRLRLPLRLDGVLPCAARRRGVDREPLRADRARDDRIVAHRVRVGVHEPRDDRLAEPERGLDGRDAAVARDGIGGEQHAGRLRLDHALHDDAHADRAVVDAVPHAVGDRALGVEGCPATRDVADDRRRADDVEIRVLLPGERRRRKVLGRGARSHRVRGVRAEAGERASDLRREVVGDRGRLDRRADLRGERADRVAVVEGQARELRETFDDLRRDGGDSLVRVGRDAEARRHAHAVDARELAQVRRLAADARDARPIDRREIEHVAIRPRAHRRHPLGTTPCAAGAHRAPVRETDVDDDTRMAVSSAVGPPSGGRTPAQRAGDSTAAPTSCRKPGGSL